MDRPRIVRTRPTPDIDQLRAELASHLTRYPVETWPSPVLAAVNGVLTGYGIWRESSLEDLPDTRPFRLVK